MPGMSPAKKKIFDRRNDRIWQMYNDERNPKSLQQIADVMTSEGSPMTKQNVHWIIIKMRSKQEVSIDK